MSEQRKSPGSFGVQFQWTPKLIAWLVLLVVSLILVVQNLDHVDVRILFWDIHMRLVWALLGVFLLGALLGWALPRLRSRGKGRQ